MLNQFSHNEIVMLIEKYIDILNLVVTLYEFHSYKLILKLFLVLCIFNLNVLDQEFLVSVCLSICIVKVNILLPVDLIGSARVLSLYDLCR